MVAVEFVKRFGKELSFFSFAMTMRFLGRYPETGRSYYKPPPVDEDPPDRNGQRRPCCHEHGLHHLLEMTYSHLIFSGDYGQERITHRPGCTR
ncbi:unnamed protein product [Calypogeia fissa]